MLVAIHLSLYHPTLFSVGCALFSVGCAYATVNITMQIN